MDALIHVAGLSQRQHQQSSARPFYHLRSLSSVAASAPPSTPPSPTPNQPRSSPRLTVTPMRPSHSVPLFSDEMSTLPDPRSRCRSGTASNHTDSDALRHPDLDDELATLSAKLVNAINHQTLLDDTLSATRHELQTAQERVHQLESESQNRFDKSGRDVWVRRSSLDAERKAMEAEKKAWEMRLADETEKEKRKIEQELENLTTALFEEANKMVIAAKEEAQLQNEVLQRKNEQLKVQLDESEGLLKSQQEQLSQLKAVIGTMASERDDVYGTAPPSPGISRPDAPADDDGASRDGLADGYAPLEGFSPCNPTSLHHLVQPVLRTDLAAYEDFVALARISQKRRGSRISSGSLGGIAALTLGLGGSTSSAHASNASSTSLAASAPAPNSSAPQSPNTPASSTSGGSPTVPSTPTPHLKDTRFYKRILVDDVEPTLRLDAAPGLSWLARRSVLASVTDGYLIVEPIPDSTTYMAIVQPQHHPCTLCGESRKSPEHLRNHRFKTSESVSAQRYALCSFCLNRVRSTCDFLGFLRLVRDGHWRAEDEGSEKAAWEESVKLREQMFWARVGGGVVPASQAAGPGSADTDPGSRPSQDHLGIIEEADTSREMPDAAKVADEIGSGGGLSRHGSRREPREPCTPPDRTEGGRGRTSESVEPLAH